MNKLFFAFIFFFTLTVANAQVDKIKIVKEKDCSFTTIIENGLNGKTLTVGEFGYSNLKGEDISYFLANRNVMLTDEIFINKDSFEIKFANICKINNMFLKQIVVNSIKKNKNEIFINFIYEEI